MSYTIYHNPRCSKSRQTLALLEERDIEPNVVNYLETPPSADVLGDILGKLNIAPPALIRFKETRAKELGITPGDDRSRDEWIGLMVANPVLIERPIVVRGGHAVVGRPPENVLDLI